MSEYTSLKTSTQSEYSWLSKSTQRPHICEVQAAAAGGRVVWSPVNRALSLLPSPCNDLNIAPISLNHILNVLPLLFFDLHLESFLDSMDDKWATSISTKNLEDDIFHGEPPEENDA